MSIETVNFSLYLDQLTHDISARICLCSFLHLASLSANSFLHFIKYPSIYLLLHMIRFFQVQIQPEINHLFFNKYSLINCKWKLLFSLLLRHYIANTENLFAEIGQINSRPRDEYDATPRCYCEKSVRDSLINGTFVFIYAQTSINTYEILYINTYIKIAKRKSIDKSRNVLIIRRFAEIHKYLKRI